MPDPLWYDVKEIVRIAVFHRAFIQKDASEFQPIRMAEVELSRPLIDIPLCERGTERCYHQIQLLVRLHTQPLGVLDLTCENGDLRAVDYAGKIWQMLSEVINDHLHEDGLPEASTLTVSGLSYSDELHCLQERGRLLQTPPFASIVVCTRDRTEQFANCLPSLLELEYPHYELIVVDNAPCTSSTSDLIGQRYGHLPQVRYVREERPGLSWARNCGLQAASGEIIAYTDDDALVDSHWLTALAQNFLAAENVACVTGLTLSAEIETQAQDWFEQFGGHSKGRGFERGIFNLTTHRVQNPYLPVPAFGAGVNMAFKTSLLRQLGGFAPELGAGTLTQGGEDTAAYWRVITGGYTLIYEPSAIVRHFHRRDYAGLHKQLYGYGVAITSFYTWCSLQGLQHFYRILGILPQAIRYLLAPRSTRTSKMRQNYPSELTRAELRGMLYGPIAYLRSRWRLRHIIQQFGSLEIGHMYGSLNERRVR